MLDPKAEEDPLPAVTVAAEELDPLEAEDGCCWLYGVESKAKLDDPPVRTDETAEETSESMDETMDETGSSKPELELELEIDAGSDELPDAADELIPSSGSRVVVALPLPLSLVRRDEDEGKSTMLDVTAVGAAEEAVNVTSRTFDVTAEGGASADEAGTEGADATEDAELPVPFDDEEGEGTASPAVEEGSSTLLDALELSGTDATLLLLLLLAAASLADVVADDAGCAEEALSILALALVLDGSGSCVWVERMGVDDGLRMGTSTLSEMIGSASLAELELEAELEGLVTTVMGEVRNASAVVSGSGSRSELLELEELDEGVEADDDNDGVTVSDSESSAEDDALVLAELLLLLELRELELELDRGSLDASLSADEAASRVEDGLADDDEGVNVTAALLLLLLEDGSGDGEKAGELLEREDDEDGSAEGVGTTVMTWVEVTVPESEQTQCMITSARSSFQLPACPPVPAAARTLSHARARPKQRALGSRGRSQRQNVPQ